MSVQNFVPIHFADVEVVAREERLGSGICFNRDMNVCTNLHRNPFNRCWDSSVWTDYQAGTTSLEAKKPQVWWSILTGIIHDPLPRDRRAMFFFGCREVKYVVSQEVCHLGRSRHNRQLGAAPLSPSRGEKCCSSPHHCIYVNWRTEGFISSSVMSWLWRGTEAILITVYVLLIGFPSEHLCLSATLLYYFLPIFLFSFSVLNSPLFEAWRNCALFPN